jgi:nucleotide-binding universal stress UspA family protein
MFRKILVAVDGSPNSDRAVEAAAEVAAAHASDMTICHVFYIPEHYVTDLAGPLRAAMREDAEKILEHASSVAKENGVEAATHLIQEGHPADAILDFATELGVGLIVVGVRGKTGDRARAMGSVSGTIASNATASVLLVRRA